MCSYIIFLHFMVCSCEVDPTFLNEHIIVLLKFHMTQYKNNKTIFQLLWISLKFYSG